MKISNHKLCQLVVKKFVKGNINLDGKMIKDGKEINISKLNSDNFNVLNLNADGKKHFIKPN